LLAATVSFAILDYYVRVQGTAQVSSPEFYLGSAGEETLLINEKSPDCAHFSLEHSLTRAFKTEENLGGINFNYIPKVKFSIRAKVNGTTTPQDLTLRFGYVGNNGPVTICEANVSISNQMDNYTTDFIKCLDKPINVRNFYYEMKGNCEDCEYVIGKCAGGFYTKVKLGK